MNTGFFLAAIVRSMRHSGGQSLATGINLLSGSRLKGRIFKGRIYTLKVQKRLPMAFEQISPGRFRIPTDVGSFKAGYFPIPCRRLIFQRISTMCLQESCYLNSLVSITEDNFRFILQDWSVKLGIFYEVGTSKHLSSQTL